MGKLDVKSQSQGDKAFLTFAGSIDEDAKLPDPATLQASAEITVDMGGEQAINSCGVREWVKWVKAVPPSAKLIYVNSPKVIVDQMNMIGGLLPKGTVIKSFQVPYFCESCKQAHNMTFNEGKEFQGKTAKPPELTCPKCGSPMELDIIEAKYFKFLTTL